MEKKIKFLFIIGLVLFVPATIVFADSTTICVDSLAYDVVKVGEKVNNIYSISYENITNQSILPQKYFDMENDFNKLNLSISEVDKYLDTYKNLNKFNNSSLLDSSIKQFLDNHYDTYTNNEYYLALKDKTKRDKYLVNAVSLGLSCKVNSNSEGYTVNICPTADITSIYNSINFNYSISKVSFNETTNKFEYSISDSFTNEQTKEKVSFNGNLILREVKVGNTVNSKGESIPDIAGSNFNREGVNFSTLSNKSNTFILEKNQKQTRTINEGETIILEFYLNGSSLANSGGCGDSYLGYVIFSAPTYAYITNPYYDSKICKDLRSNDQNETYKRAYVPDCYSEEVEYFTKIKTGVISEDTIRSDIESLNDVLLEDKDSSNDISTNYCFYSKSDEQQSNSSVKSYIYNPFNSKYWAAKCSETVVVSYDPPKKTIAGGGFTYNSKIEVKRTCEPILLKKVESQPACEYSVECYGGPSSNRHTGGAGAGPNEDFDSCIYSCDSGSYTKKCINSCYNLVYKNNNDSDSVSSTFNFSSSLNPTSLVNNFSFSRITKVSSGLGVGSTTPRGNTIVGNGVTSNNDPQCNKATQTCTSEHGITYPYANVCNGTSSPVVCYEVQLSSQCGGGMNEDEKKKSEEDYNALIKKLKEYEKSEISELSIIDSYKKNKKNTELLKTTWKSEDILNSKIVVSEVKEEKISSIKYTDSDSKDISRYSVGKTYEVEIPQAYVDVLTADVRYTSSDIKKESYERDGGNKYYTDIKTGAFNNYYPVDWSYNLKHSTIASLKSKYLGNNIKVVFKNIGTNQSKGYTWDEIDINCFYGVYNQINIQCEEPICDDSNVKPTSPPQKDGDNFTNFGIQYMFRQVNLSDLFPDRNPRYNWNNDSSKMITEKIESMGDNVYNEENVVYEFTITKSQINEIRKYNKEAESYQDYPGMSCSSKSDGEVVCTSAFMKNNRYVTKK